MKLSLVDDDGVVITIIDVNARKEEMFEKQQKEIDELTEQGDRLDDLITSLAKDIVSMMNRIERLEKKTWAISDDGHYLPFTAKEKE